MTPKKFYTILNMSNELQSENVKSNWERTRLAIYYNMEFKHPMMYKDFCKQFLPMSWDKEEEPYEITEELLDQVFNTPKANEISVEVSDMSQLSGLI